MRYLSFLALSFLVITACGTVKKSSSNSISNTNTRTNATPSMPVGMSPDASDKEFEALESGVASWYGPQFDGKLTANGEVYDMTGITAAHRTLPFGTVLLVENLDNGRTVTVRVNDRGPFAKDRIIDLSKGAAEIVDMIGPGTARVRLYLIEGDLKNSRVTDLKVANFTVQLGSYKDRATAERLQSQISGSRVEKLDVRGEMFYRVYYGIYQDTNKAEEDMRKLRSRGFEGFVKQIENN